MKRRVKYFTTRLSKKTEIKKALWMKKGHENKSN